MAPEFLGGFMVWIATFAAGEPSARTEKTFTARNGEWHNDAIAWLQICYLRSNLDNFTHRLMTEHVAALHAWNHSVIDMQIRTTDRAGRDLDDRIPRMLDCRVGDGVTTDVMLSVPA
jgi:hypothetical protein